jgi:hypothetical protein
MYQFLDEHDMWSLVEKNPKEAGVLEKQNTKGKFMRIKKNSKNHVFFNRNGEHIANYLIHLNKNKTK